MKVQSDCWRLVAFLGAIGLSGCLVESAPDKQPPVRTQPRLFLNQAVPEIYQLLEGPPRVTVNFNIPIHPQDHGQEYWTHRFWNYGLEGEEYDGTAKKAADAEPITFSVNLPESEGCSQLTIFVATPENYDPEKNLPSELRDAAMVTWWVLITGPNSEEPLLSDCPAARPPDPMAEE